MDPSHEHHNLRGAGLMTIAMALFATEDAFIKILAERMPIGEILVYLGLSGAAVFALLAGRKRYCAISTQFWHPTVMARNAGEIIGTSAYLIALTTIPLALAASIQQALPIFVTLGAILFLGEKVGWRRWTAIGVALFGVLIMLRPGAEGFQPAALFSVIGALGMAGRDLVTRKIPATIHPLQIAGWGFFSTALAGAALLAWSGGAVRPTATELALLAGALGTGTIGYYLLTVASTLGEVAFVVPFRYTRLLFALIAAVLVFGEVPTRSTLIGAAIVVGAGIYTLLRQRRSAAIRPSPSAP